MSVTTIADILNPVVPPDSPVQYPLRGTVKIAWPAKPGDGNFSASQGFVLQDNTGEITVYWSETTGQPFVPVSQGESIEICARMNAKNKLGGAFKKVAGPNTKKPGEPQLKVYGSHLQRVGAAPAGHHPASAQQGTSPAWRAFEEGFAGARSVQDPPWMNDKLPAGDRMTAYMNRPPDSIPAPRQPGKLFEGEARELWARNFRALAALFGYRDDPLSTLAPHAVEVLAAASTTILIGIQRGDILRQPQGEDDDLGF